MVERDKTEHPSFGFIRASRVQGHKTLFDSALKHQHYIEVEIGNSYTERAFNQNYVYANSMRGLITISMSESQFAQFITSMNTGSGAPCTLTYVDGERVPDPPVEQNTKERFADEVRAKGEQIISRLDAAMQEVDALLLSGKATKANLKSVKDKVAGLKSELTSNMPFMIDQFSESVEKITDRARMDLNAHAMMIGLRLGQGGTPS